MCRTRNDEIRRGALSGKVPRRRIPRMLPVVMFISIGLLVCMADCGRKDDVAVIRRIIQKGAASAEEKQIGDLMALTGENFLAMPGRHDARMVRNILSGAFRHYGQFKIHYPQPAVEMAADGHAATAIVYFLIVRHNQSIPGLKELYDDPRRWLASVGEKADLYQLKLQFKQNNGGWLVHQAQLEGFKGTGF